MMQEVPWLQFARSLKGLREIPGPQHEPQILELAKLAGMPWIKDDETAWCATFVGGCLAKVKIKPSGSPAARSYLQWGIDARESPLQGIPVGSIAVLNRPPKEWEGHVMFPVAYRPSDGAIWGLGGNQKNQVSIEPFPTHRVIGVRWPVEWRGDLRLLTRLPPIESAGELSAQEA